MKTKRAPALLDAAKALLLDADDRGETKDDRGNDYDDYAALRAAIAREEKTQLGPNCGLDQAEADLYRKVVKADYHIDGQHEIDDGAPISVAAMDEGEPIEGAYVQAWVWVSREEIAGKTQ